MEDKNQYQIHERDYERMKVDGKVELQEGF